jgi:ABC-2 type transport system permease protein
VSGERERGTLESLLLAPASRRGVVGGKLLAALSLWGAALVLAVPYLWFLARDVGVFGAAIGAALVAGTLVAVTLAALGMGISVLARSNRLSLSVGLFVLLALYAPTQLPTGARQGWAADALLRANPVTAAEHYISTVVINQHGFTQDAAWLVSPAVAAVALTAAVLVFAPRFLTLRGAIG